MNPVYVTMPAPFILLMHFYLFFVLGEMCCGEFSLGLFTVALMISEVKTTSFKIQ